MSEHNCEFYINRKNGQKFIVQVDRDDLERLIQLNKPWNIVFTCGNYYVKWSKRYLGEDGWMHGTTVYLQRWIVDQFETNRKIVVDHRDHNTLDNRKQNLRVTYITNNNRNRNGKNKNNKSGYRNVFWNSSDNCWVVSLMKDGKCLQFSGFGDVHTAGKFAEQKRKELYGKYAGVSDRDLYDNIVSDGLSEKKMSINEQIGHEN